MNKKPRGILCILLTAILLLSVLPQTVWADDSLSPRQKRVVTVAYPIQQNLSDIDEHGEYSGYLTDYLKMVAEFAGWDINYVTYPDLPLNEQMTTALAAVENGEVDLLGGMLYSEGLAEQLLYPRNSCGAVYTTLETLDSNYRLKDTNYMEHMPLRVAILESAKSRNAEMTAFADSMGLSCEYISCKTVNEQIAALKDGTADALVNVSLTFLSGMKTLASFAPRPYYYVTGQGNEALLAELDAAIEKIDRTAPYFENRLQSQYFTNTLTNFSLSENEHAYVKQHGSLEVLVCPRHAPFSFMNSDGKLCGIAVSIMDEIGKAAGISVNYHLLHEGEELADLIASGQYDLLIGPPQDSDFAINNGLITSNKFLETNLTMYVNRTSQNKPKSECVLALNKEFPVPSAYAYKEIKYYDDVDACMDAVNRGEADYGYANRYTVDFYNSIHTYRSLSYLSLTDYNRQMGFYFPQNADENLLSLVNKYIRSMPAKDVQNYLAQALSQKNNDGIKSFVRNNPLMAIAVCAIFVLLIGLVSVLSAYIRTNKKRNKKLQQAYAAKSDFLSRMSHDMRTPMNGIIGLTGFLRERRDLPPEAVADLAAIDDSAQYLRRLINDTLDMSKIESAKLALNPEVIHAQALVTNIVTSVTPALQEKGITLEVIPINAQLGYVRADWIRLQQIFINILSNAVKFTPRGGKIRWEIQCLKREKGIAYDRISIEDTGIGMSEEFLPHIFDAFTQESQPVSSNYSGTGLGMAIVKNLVELMGGTIQVESQPGVGTKVTAYLSFELADQGEIPCETDAQPLQSMAGKRILLCEDHPLNIQIATRLLEKQGVRVECAKNGQLAVEQFSQSQPGYFSGILMDIRMPVMDGLTAAKTIRALDRTDAKTIPIIAMTANAFDEDIQKSKAAGMNAHLAKPIDPQQLYQTLQDFIFDEAPSHA